MQIEDAYRNVISFLNTNPYDYLVIGGIAVSILGEPRLTGDIDLCIFIKKRQIDKLLNDLLSGNFTFEEKETKQRINKTGTFRVYCEKIPVDFIIASTEFEDSALRRKTIVEVFGVKANFPSPEDLILFKIIPGRTIDIADVETIALRHSGKLDSKYLQSWAMRLSEEAEDMRIYNEAKRLLKL